MLSTILSLLTSHWAIAGGIGTVVTAVLPFMGTIMSGGTTAYAKFGLYALIALAIFGSGCLVTYKIMEGDVATVQTQIANATAKANADALKQEQAYETKANQYIAQAQAEVTKAKESETTIRKVIYATPKSYACSRSPAISALLNAMRSPSGN